MTVARRLATVLTTVQSSVLSALCVHSRMQELEAHEVSPEDHAGCRLCYVLGPVPGRSTLPLSPVCYAHRALTRIAMRSGQRRAHPILRMRTA